MTPMLSYGCNFHTIELENKLLNKNEAKIISDLFKKINKKDEYLSIIENKSKFFFTGSDETLRKIKYIIKKIDKKIINIEIELRYGLINKDYLQDLGINAFGLYSKNRTKNLYNLKHFGFGGLSSPNGAISPSTTVINPFRPITAIDPNSDPTSGLTIPVTFGGKNIATRRLTFDPVRAQESTDQFRTTATLSAKVENRKKFKLKAGNQIPYYTLNNKFNYNRLAQVFELNYINDGASISFTPIVKEHGIKLKLFIEDKSLANTTIGTIIAGGNDLMRQVPPLYNVLKLIETITLKEGESICIFKNRGSMADNLINETNLNLPPLVKKLFSYTSDIDMYDYSFILITPKIIRE